MREAGEVDMKEEPLHHLWCVRGESTGTKVFKIMTWWHLKGIKSATSHFCEEKDEGS